MKKTLTIVIIAVLALVLATTVVNATTKSELQAYLTKSHTIAGKTVSLTSAEIKQVKDYFAANDITDEQATFIKGKVDEAIAVMEAAGVSEVSKLSATDKQTVLNKAQEAAAKVGLSVNSSTGVVTNNAGEVVFKPTDTKLVQTGASYVPYIVAAGLAIIAVAGIVIYKKARA